MPAGLRTHAVIPGLTRDPGLSPSDQGSGLDPGSPLRSARDDPRFYGNAAALLPLPRDLPGDAGLRALHRLAGREPGGAVVQSVADLPAIIVGDRLHEGAQAGRVLALATARPAAGLVRANLPDAENVGEAAQDQRPRLLAALEIGDRRDGGGGVLAFRHGGSP